MTKGQDLTHDIILHYHNVHAKNARIHERVTFFAGKRAVEYHSRYDRKRALPFLPLKHSETAEYLEIPDYIATESQLIDYIYEKKPFWLNNYRR